MTTKQDWRIKAYPVQVRVETSDGKGWALYSRHREWGETQQRALVEAQNAFGAGRVEMVDLRDADKMLDKRKP